MAVTVSVNGKREELEAPVNVAELLESKKIRPQIAVVAVNRERVSRDDLGTTVANDGDLVEIMIQLAGGSDV
jgi:thiamine biosynthesis protein ThiS